MSKDLPPVPAPDIMFPNRQRRAKKGDRVLEPQDDPLGAPVLLDGEGCGYRNDILMLAVLLQRYLHVWRQTWLFWIQISCEEPICGTVLYSHSEASQSTLQEVKNRVYAKITLKTKTAIQPLVRTPARPIKTYQWTACWLTHGMICTPYVYVLPSTCSYHNAMRQGSKAEGFSGRIIMPLSTLQGVERLQL